MNMNRNPLADSVDQLTEENDKLRSEVTELKRELLRDKDCHQADMKMLVERTRERDAALLQKDELREALRELVHEVEDSWHHHGRCMIGTDEQKPETKCECGPDLEVPLELLCRIRPVAEKRVEGGRKCDHSGIENSGTGYRCAVCKEQLNGEPD